MSKTTFDPNAKTMTIGDTSLPEEPAPEEQDPSSVPSTDKSTFETLGGSKWKAMLESITYPSEGETPDPLGVGAINSSITGTEDDIASVSDLFKPNGPFGPSPAITVKSIFDIRLNKETGKEYEDYFQPIDLPTSVAKASALYPVNLVGFENSVKLTRASYDNHLALYRARKTAAEKVLSGGQISTREMMILRQFIGKLNDAINITERDKEDLNRLESDRTGKAPTEA